MKAFIYSLLAAILLSNCSVIGSVVGIAAASSSIQVRMQSTASYCLCLCPILPWQDRSTNTCADPTITDVYVAAFNAARTLHIFRPLWVAVDNASGGTSMQVQTQSFCAWQTPQDFTVPIFQLFNPTTDDAIYLISTDGNPPTANGF